MAIPGRSHPDNPSTNGWIADTSQGLGRIEHAHIVAGELKLVAQFAVFVLKRPDTVVCSMKLLLKEVCRLLGVLWDIHIRHGPGCPGLEGAGAGAETVGRSQ